MRLVCPNCEAQYEVGEGVIPDEGRDVQCSNCGNTWFQHPEGFDPRPAEDPAPAPYGGNDAGRDRARRATAENFEDNLRQALGDDPEDEPLPDPDPSGPAPRTVTPRRELSADVAGILREEAEHERTIRKREAETRIETQPDLGLEETTEPNHNARAEAESNRVTNLRKSAGAVAATSRRNLLPDIEEINSTLRSTTERKREASGPVSDDVMGYQSRSRGFRMGFMLMVMLALVAIIAYLFSATIIEIAPGTEPYLKAFIRNADIARVWLENTVERLTLFIESQTGS